eukprot:gb/GECH01013856.1/.p1 GENE.gb/GECH01013856.1/~~gb/GECH01013856.1/.p1  ORF type:complete len:120 (+),score=9.75 gb/GECH01013856.1/:1-360(+)
MITIRISWNIIGVAAIAGVAIATRPDINTFRPFFREWVSKQLGYNPEQENSNLAGQLINGLTSVIHQGASELFSLSSQRDVYNFYVANVVLVRFEDTFHIFIGLFNHWFPVVGNLTSIL